MHDPLDIAESAQRKVLGHQGERLTERRPPRTIICPMYTPPRHRITSTTSTTSTLNTPPPRLPPTIPLHYSAPRPHHPHPAYHPTIPPHHSTPPYHPTIPPHLTTPPFHLTIPPHHSTPGYNVEISTDPVRPIWADVEPEGGTLVCFYSDAVEHEVLVTHRERQCVVGWLRGPAPPVDLSAG